MKRKAAAIKIQTYTRGRLTRKNYYKIRMSALVLETGFRAMAARRARDIWKRRKQTKASTSIQVKSVLVMLIRFSIIFLCCLKF
jgi:myosin-5